jgi:hypothetical protein
LPRASEFRIAFAATFGTRPAWQIGTLIGFAAGVVQIVAGAQPGGRIA